MSANHPSELNAAIARLIDDALADVAPTEEDFLLLVGSTTLIGLVTALYAQWTDGDFRLLQWDRPSRRYVPLSVRLDPLAQPAAAG